MRTNIEDSHGGLIMRTKFEDFHGGPINKDKYGRSKLKTYLSEGLLRTHTLDAY